MACWRAAAWVPVCSHCWRRPSATVPRALVQASSRCASWLPSCACSSACERSTVRSSASACPAKAAAVPARASRWSAASASLWPRWLVRACSQACAALSAARSRRAETCSTSPAERCAKVAAKPSSELRSASAWAVPARWCSVSACCQRPATAPVVVAKRSDRPSSCCCTACVTVSRQVSASRARPAMVVSTAGWIAAPAAWALWATLSLSDCSTEAASCL